MTTTTDHPSSLPEQEPDRCTTIVLIDDVTFISTDITGRDCWESIENYGMSWDELRDFAAEKGGATLFDIADLPTGLTEVQKEVIRSAEATLTICGSDFSAGVLRDAFPGVFADDLVTARWQYGYSDEKLTELLRVAEMEGAHVTATRYGATRSGNVHHVERSVRIHLGIFSDEVVIDLLLGGWTITVTAPKPMRPGADIPDEVVEAAVEAATREWDSGRSVAYSDTMRLALAAADAKRTELAGGVA